MPSREKSPAAGKKVKNQKPAKRSIRKHNFQNAPWYAATAQRLSVSRSRPEPSLTKTLSPAKDTE